jgi:peroxiredoxin
MIRNLLLVMSLVFASSAFAAPKTGEAAPDFTLKGQDGKDYKLSSFKGKTVVLEWFNNDCPYVKKHYDTKNMQNLQKAHTGKGALWFSIISSKPGSEGHVDAAGATKLIADRGMASTAILLDEKGATGKLYGAKTTPHMFIIDKAGKVAYQGAIDDQPSANEKTLKGAMNYVDAAMTSLEKGEPVKTASTTPYGCSVKY